MTSSLIGMTGPEWVTISTALAVVMLVSIYHLRAFLARRRKTARRRRIVERIAGLNFDSKKQREADRAWDR